MKTAEFFAGMGLMRAGLNRCGIETVFANDIDTKRAALYCENWGTDEFRLDDIRDLHGGDIPAVDIATASFPCVDLSLAGQRSGLKGTRSSLVFEFLRILGEMPNPPTIVLLENVSGFLTSNGGRDFEAVVEALKRLAYRVRHICVDAAAFVPQSRVRVFVVGYRDIDMRSLPASPTQGNSCLADVIHDNGTWWDQERMTRFLESMSEIQLARVETRRQQGYVSYHGAYRRTRKGRAVWEVRSDEIAGALRTTAGGSGRQAILRAGCGDCTARWMDVPEYAALQGADGMTWESVTPRQAMYAFGDAVCVPVVEWIAKHVLLPAYV